LSHSMGWPATFSLKIFIFSEQRSLNIKPLNRLA
jgi:hypothetical protein